MGVCSVGWAIVVRGENPTVECGSRIFRQDVEGNAERRAKRSARKAKKRKKTRMRRLLEVLEKAGFPVSGRGEERVSLYAARKKALVEEVDPGTFVGIVALIAKRRGYMPPRATMFSRQTEDEKKTRKVKDEKETHQTEDEKKTQKAIEKTKRDVEDSGAETIGAYLADLESRGERVRGGTVIPTAAALESELKKIWKKQAEFRPELFTDDLLKRVVEEIFFRRRAAFSLDLIGDCELEPGEKRCSKADPTFQEFRALKETSDLRVVEPDETKRRLTGEERERVLNLLMDPIREDGRVSPKDVRDAIGLEDEQKLTSESEEEGGGRVTFSGVSTAKALKRAFGSERFATDGASLVAVLRALLDGAPFDGPPLDLSEEDAKAFREVSKAKIEPGRSSLSLKAVEKMLPFMREGKDEASVRKAAGYGVRLQPVLPEVPRDAERRVLDRVQRRVLTETVKVVNAVVRKMGAPPENIVVEVAKEANYGPKTKKKIEKEQREREKKRRNLVDDLIKRLKERPTSSMVKRYELYQECGGVSVYSGKPISFPEELFGNTVQIDHIVPRSKMGDDSKANMVLCFADENAKKGDKTPSEAFSGEKWGEICARLDDLVKEGKMPGHKRDRIVKEKSDEEAVSRRESRALNDTRTAAAAVKRAVSVLGAPVVAMRGGVTADVRRKWGLDAILSPGQLRPTKNRGDHRHHAVDAAVLAVVGNRVKEACSRNGLPLPWDGFQADLRSAVERCVVSHRSDRRLVGAFHDGAVLGTRTVLKADGSEEKAYVKRQMLNEFDENTVKRVFDPQMKKLIEAHIAEYRAEVGDANASVKKAMEKPLYVSPGGPIVKKTVVRHPSVRGVPKDVGGRVRKWSSLSSNDHVVFFAEGLKMTAATRSTFDSAKIRRRDGCTRPQFAGERRPTFSLGAGDSVLLKFKGDERETAEIVANPQHDLYVVQKMGHSGITLKKHYDAGPVADKNEARAAGEKKINVSFGSKSRSIELGKSRVDGRVLTGIVKVSVDPIGRISFAND